MSMNEQKAFKRGHRRGGKGTNSLGVLGSDLLIQLGDGETLVQANSNAGGAHCCFCQKGGKAKMRRKEGTERLGIHSFLTHIEL